MSFALCFIFPANMDQIYVMGEETVILSQGTPSPCF